MAMQMSSNKAAVSIGSPSNSRKVAANISAKVNPAKLTFGGSGKFFEKVVSQPYKPSVKEKVVPVPSKPSVNKTLNEGEENNQRNTEVTGKVSDSVVSSGRETVSESMEKKLSDGVRHENTMSVDDVGDGTLASGTSPLGGGRFALNPSASRFDGTPVQADFSALGASDTPVSVPVAGTAGKKQMLLGAAVVAAVVIVIVVLLVGRKKNKKKKR